MFKRTLVATVMWLCAIEPALRAADVTLAWDPPVDGVTTGYIVAYGPASGWYEQQVDAGMTTQFTVPGLVDGTWFFAVRAYDAAGTLSGFSNEVTQTIVNPSPTITSLSLTSNVPSPQTVGFYVTWTALASGGVTPYQYQWWSAKNGGSWALIRDWDPADIWTSAPSVGDYVIRVDARSAGAVAAELSQSMPFSIVKQCRGAKCR